MMSDLIVDTVAGVIVAVSGGYSIKSWRFQKRIETIGRMQGLLIRCRTIFAVEYNFDPLKKILNQDMSRTPTLQLYFTPSQLELFQTSETVT